MFCESDCAGGGIVVSMALVRSTLSSKSSSSDVVVESEFGSMWAASTVGAVASMLDVVVVSVVGRCDMVGVKIANHRAPNLANLLSYRKLSSGTGLKASSFIETIL
jgi:hypothetical protein